MHACLLVVGDNVEAQLEPFMDLAAMGIAVEGDDPARNPDAKYDYYVVGGRWKHRLELKTPRKVAIWFGLFSRRIVKTHTALKSEIKLESLLRHPPVSILYNGSWEDAELVIGSPPNDQWCRRFEKILRSLPDSARLTIMDYHA